MRVAVGNGKLFFLFGKYKIFIFASELVGINKTPRGTRNEKMEEEEEENSPKLKILKHKHYLISD